MHEDLLSRSVHLKSSLAWSLYNVGELAKCLDALTRLQEHRDCPEDRNLAVHLAIASGDWHSLATFVEREWERREDRSAEELLRAGQIAQELTSGRAQALIVEAAAKAADDPHVLLGCYSSAVAAGWEDETTVQWIERAATLSDSGGPVERVSLRDLIDRHPDWQQREAEAWDQFNAGLVPMFTCARLLNRSLAEFLMLPVLANVETIDPRRRVLLYSHSGARRGVSSRMPHSIAIDPTALLIAGTCGLLERIMRAALPAKIAETLTAPAISVVPLRDRCSFGRFPWLISQALSVTYMAGERRLYLERNYRLPESPAHSRRRNREGPASSKGLNSQRGFGPAVEPRRKSRPRSTSLHGSSPCKCQRLSTLRWDRLPPSRPSTKSGARAGGRRLSDRRLHRWLAGTSASAPSSHGAADLLGLNRAHICVRNH